MVKFREINFQSEHEQFKNLQEQKTENKKKILFFNELREMFFFEDDIEKLQLKTFFRKVLKKLEKLT